MRVREVFFWLHFAVGLAVGAVIFVMCVTGALLTYERQITEWADREYRVAPPPSGERLPVSTLVARAQAVRTGAPPTAVTLQADPVVPAAVSFGREGLLYVNPYTGQVLGEGSPGVRAFFHRVTEWHRWLGAKGEGRDRARAVTGASNLGFLILVLSGLILWVPREWTRRRVRNVAWFRRGLRGKARDFNWHNVLGLWAWAPLVVIVASGVVMSYPWANGLVFGLVGERPPERPAEGSREGAGRGERGEPGEEGPGLDGLDRLWSRAEREFPGWQSLSARLPDSPRAPVTFTIARGDRGRPDLRAQLTLDRRSGEVVRWETFVSQGPGRRLRSWIRWAHTGEAAGFFGQTLAGLATASAAVLVWTGWAMAWRRLFPRRRARMTSSEELS
jgi:uncharacterized iron-regulated membrane protein